MKKQETKLQKFINFMVHAFIHVGIMTSIILTLFGICYNIIQGENMYIVKIATTIVSAVFLSYIVSAVTTSKQLKNMDLKIEEKLKAVIKDTLSKEHENLSGQHGGLSKEHEKLLGKHEEITEAHINHTNDIKNVDDSLKSIKDDFIKPIFEEANRSKNVSEVSQDMYDHLNFLKKDIQEVSVENLKLKEEQKNQSEEIKKVNSENLKFKEIQKSQSKEIQKLKVQNKNLQKKYDNVIKINNIKKGNSKLGQVVDKVEDTPKPKKHKTIIR